MKSMKFLLVAFLVVGGYSLIYSEDKSLIGGGVTGRYTLDFGATVGQAFTGSGTVYKIVGSTGNGSDYFIAFDSASLVGSALTAFTTGQMITVPVVHTGTGTTNGYQTQPIANFADMGGIRVTNGLNVRTSNGINRVTVYFKRN